MHLSNPLHFPNAFAPNINSVNIIDTTPVATKAIIAKLVTLASNPFVNTIPAIIPTAILINTSAIHVPLQVLLQVYSSIKFTTFNILIIIFIASLAFLTYRVGTDIKAKKDEIKEELRKEKEKAEKKQEEEEKKQQELEDKINKEQEEYHENFSKDSFNSTFEMNQGTKSGMFAKSQVDNIIKNNKKDKEHLIEVIFDGTSYGTDPSNISNVKNNLREFNGYKFQEYEISLDYDDNGYVNKITIETR